MQECVLHWIMNFQIIHKVQVFFYKYYSLNNVPSKILILFSKSSIILESTPRWSSTKHLRLGKTFFFWANDHLFSRRRWLLLWICARSYPEVRLELWVEPRALFRYRSCCPKKSHQKSFSTSSSKPCFSSCKWHLSAKKKIIVLCYIYQCKLFCFKKLICI